MFNAIVSSSTIIFAKIYPQPPASKDFINCNKHFDILYLLKNIKGLKKKVFVDVCNVCTTLMAGQLHESHTSNTDVIFLCESRHLPTWAERGLRI